RRAHADAAVDETRREILGVGVPGAAVAGHQRRPSDGRWYAALRRLTNERFGDALALGVTQMDTVDRRERIEALGDNGRRRRRVTDADTRDEVKGLATGRGEAQQLTRCRDVRVAKLFVAVHPVDGGATVIDRVDSFGARRELSRRHAEHRSRQVGANDVNPRGVARTNEIVLGEIAQRAPLRALHGLRNRVRPYF